MREDRLKRCLLTVAMAIAWGLSLPAWSQGNASPGGGDEQKQLPRFDIISVRETHSPLIHEGMPADGYTGDGVYLGMLLNEVYSIPVFDRVLGLPAWSREKRFDIRAKVDPADVPALQKFSYSERRAMLRQILEERFQLRMHEEERVRPIYTLTASGKPGPFLVRSPLPAPGSTAPLPARFVHRTKRGELTLERFTMANFADELSSRLHTDVVDDTHLDGVYNLQLDWNPDDAAGSEVPGSAVDKPSIFTAVREQLGLKLNSGKGPVKVWVIDHIELPSEN